MSRQIGTPSGGPACEPDKLIVEIIGKDHPDTQRVVIFDAADATMQTALGDSRVVELLPDEAGDSTLHLWRWDDQPKRHLWLEIDAEQGTPIRLPLMQETHVTPRQLTRQWNVIVPVLPMTIMRGVVANHQHREYPVLCRAGFLYVFHQGQLWRELEIRQSQDGQTTYQDVRLSDYRAGNIEINQNVRTVVGQALADIWLPARWNNRAVGDIHVAYSEVQWPASRINRLQSDARLRTARCTRMDMNLAQRVFGNTSYRSAMRQQVFQLDRIPAHRPREPSREWLFDRPLKYLHDLSGQYPLQANEYAQQVHARHERGEGNPDLIQPLQTADDIRPETGAWQLALTQTLEANGSEALQWDENAYWDAKEATDDALTDARGRQIAGALIEDSLYRMRHLLLRINAAQALLQECAQRASLHPNHGSALLVQRLMVPPEIAGAVNPLHEYIHNLTEEGRRDVDVCTAEAERELARTTLRAAQDNLAAWLELPAHQHALGDQFCLQGLDYAGAFYLISQLVVSLARTPEQIDRLHGGTNDSNGSPGRRLLQTLSDNPRLPLHNMLWPEMADVDLSAPYPASISPDEESGDGRYRPHALNAIAQLDTPPSVDALQSVEGAILASLMQEPDFLLLPSLKSGANALLTIWENLHSALQEARQDHTQAQTRQRQARAQDSQAQNQKRQRQTERDGHARQVAQQRATLGAEAFPVSARLYIQNIQLLRSMLTQDFGAAVFMRRSRAAQQQYYFFGLDDLPAASEQPRRLYGELLKPDGSLLASTNQSQAALAGIEVTPSNQLLLAIPKNHRTAQAVRDLNRHFIRHQQAQVETALAQRVGQSAQLRLVDANSAMQQTHDRLAQQEQGWRKGARGVLGSKAFPAGILVLELFNVRAEFDSFAAAMRNRGVDRAALGIASGAADLLVALETLTSKMAHNQPLVKAMQTKVSNRVLFIVSDRLSAALGHTLTKTVTGKLAFQAFAGSLFVAISLYDAIHEWRLGDDAAWGYALMSMGGVVGVLGGFFVAGSATLLGLGPVGWVTLILVLAGAGLVWWLDDNPVEEWLTNGPFGSNRSDKVKHLWDDPDEAFYRLVSLLAGIRILVGSNPEQARYSGAMGLLDPSVYRAMHTTNTRVRIESNLPGLAAILGSPSIQAECQLREGQHRLTGKDHMQLSNYRLTAIGPRAQRLYPDALELFYSVPDSQSMPRQAPFSWRTYDLTVRAQVRLQGDGQEWVFPAPSPVDRLVYKEEDHGTPTFKNHRQSFWASERSHGVEAPVTERAVR